MTTSSAAKDLSLKQQLLSAAFEPSVLRREPESDIPGMNFAPEVAMFCFAHGVRLVAPEEAAANAIPVVTSFVLTAADKSRMYGACIVWYEALPPEVVSAFLDEGGGAPPGPATTEVAAVDDSNASGRPPDGVLPSADADDGGGEADANGAAAGSGSGGSGGGGGGRCAAAAAAAGLFQRRRRSTPRRRSASSHASPSSTP